MSENILILLMVIFCIFASVSHVNNQYRVLNKVDEIDKTVASISLELKNVEYVIPIYCSSCAASLEVKEIEK